MQEARMWDASGPVWRIWVLMVCLAHSLDVATTAAGLRLGIPEGNPLMAQVLSGHSEIAMYGLKAALVAVLITAVWKFRPRYPLVWPLFQIMTVMVVLTVVNNLMQVVSAIHLAS